MSERHFAGQTSEAGTFVGAGAGEPEVFIDDYHLLRGPAQLTGSLGQGVPAGSGLSVLLDLGGRGLAKVNEGRAVGVRV